jgi:inner membrane protein
MDNLSHSVASLAAGALLHRSLPSESDNDSQRIRHRLMLIACWLAGNFPDLDLVLTPLLPAPLGYLLHHRGHTHTILYALPQAMLLALLLYLLWPAARRLLQRSATARIGLLLSIGAGFVLHLMMDYLNSYGIHPFYPIDPRWLYGDMVFILEPVFWIAFGMPLAWMVRLRALKILLAALLIGVPLYFTTRGFLSWASFAVLLAMGVSLAVAQQRCGERGRSGLLLSFAFALVFIGVQHQASQRSKDMLAAQLRAADPATRVLDMSMSAFPANPLCWAFASVESNEAAGTYGLKRGIVSIAPELVPASACPVALADAPAQQPVAAGIALFSNEQGDLHQLRRLRNENCHFDAWMRFARIPSVNAEQATDIRFASSPRGNFSTIRFADFASRSCLSNVPAWAYPRHDLLTPR